MNSIIEEFRHAAAQHGSSTAATHTDRALSYIEVDQLSSQIAAQLIVHGASSSDRIAICVNGGIDDCALIIAVLKLGAAYCFQNKGRRRDERYDSISLATFRENSEKFCWVINSSTKRA